MFIQRVLKRCVAKDCFSIQRAFPVYKFHNLAYSLEEPKTVANTNIEDNITEKINSLQFKSLREDISNSNSYHNTEVLRLIILKSIQKKNINFGYEVFEDMARLNIIPDDATYTCLMDALLYEGDTEDAFELYIHAYLNNVTLDLEIFFSLLERLRKKDISYAEIAYKILKAKLIPSKYIFDHMIQIAQKAKASEFLQVLYEDIEKFGVKDIEMENSKEEEDDDDVKVSTKRKRKNRNVTSTSGRKRPPLLVIPLDGSRSMKRNNFEDDEYLRNFLKDLADSIKANKFKGEPYLYDEVTDSDDVDSDESDEGDSSEDDSDESDEEDSSEDED